MGWRHFLTLVVILSGVVACGPGPFINPFYFFGQDEAENSKPVPKAKPSDGYSCEQDKSIGPDRVRLKETITIERQFKKFISYDCEGKEVGSGWQTIKDPKLTQFIHAKNFVADGRIISTWAYNRTTCDSATFKPKKDTSAYMEIKLHTSPGTSRMQVIRGKPNYIDYEFSACNEQNSSKECTKSEVVEKGTLILFVNYLESFVDGLIEIRPNNCAP